jgi:hypothetical protein
VLACAVQDFKECLDDLEQQVADFSDEVQQLAQYSSETISFEVRHHLAALGIKQASYCVPPVTAVGHSSCVQLHAPLIYTDVKACCCTYMLQELIGHCSSVYSVNRATALALEQHLSQYGYQQPADAVLEPESLQECMQEDDESERTGPTCTAEHASACHSSCVQHGWCLH